MGPWAGGLAVLGVALVGLEYVARRSRRRTRYCVWEPGLTRRIMPDPETHPQLERLVLWQNNSEGERGSVVPSTGPGYRILVAGGSAAECFLLDQATQWPGSLEARLAGADALPRLGARWVHVGNIARSLVTAETLRMILQKVLPQYAALDAIVLMVGASDVLTWLELGAPPGRTGAPKAVAQVFSRHPEVRFGWQPKRLALTLWLQERLARRTEVMANAATWINRARVMRSQASTVIQEVPDAGHVLAHFERHLRDVVALCSRHSRRVLVVGQPWLEREEYSSEEEALFWNGGVGQAHRETIAVYYSSRVISTLMRAMYERSRKVATESGAEFVDVMARLEQGLGTFIDQFHFTPAGSHRVAAIVGEHILTSPAAARVAVPRS